MKNTVAAPLSTLEGITFEKCLRLSCNPKPHAHFYKGEDVLKVTIFSAASALHLMTLLPQIFRGKEDELMAQVEATDLPKIVVRDLVTVEAKLNSIRQTTGVLFMNTL